jgi:hypothetical protein
MADQPGKKKRGTYYTPAVGIREMAGVVKTEETYLDRYVGTADALVMAGVIAMDLLPGQPGRPVANAAYRPEGVKPVKGFWHRAPGYMTVFRNPSGKFRVEIVVSEDERLRRMTAAQPTHCVKEDLPAVAAPSLRARRSLPLGWAVLAGAGLSSLRPQMAPTRQQLALVASGPPR